MEIVRLKHTHFSDKVERTLIIISDKSTSLHECFPEPPISLPRFGGSSCGVGRNNESNNAVAVCAGIYIFLKLMLLLKSKQKTRNTDTFAVLRLNERASVSLPFVKSVSHAKARQQSENLSLQDDAPGLPEGGYVVFL